MKLKLELKEQPFVLELSNEEGLKTIIDAAPSIGGKNSGMRPMQLLAGALAGCMSIDVLSILQKQRVTVQRFSVHVEAGRKDTVPSAFETIVLVFRVDAGVPIGKLDKAVSLSHEKYCSVSASLNPEVKITTITQHFEA